MAHFLWKHWAWGEALSFNTLLVNSGALEFVTVVCRVIVGCGSAVEVCLVCIRP